MKDLARHLARARTVPKASEIKSPQQGPPLDSWRVEEVSPRAAVREVPGAPDLPHPTGGRPSHPTEERRAVRWVSYFTEGEDKRLTGYLKKRRLSRSDAMRELVLLGLEALKLGTDNEKAPPGGGARRR